MINVLFGSSMLLLYTAGLFCVFYTVEYARSTLLLFLGGMLAILSGAALVIH